MGDPSLEGFKDPKKKIREFRKKTRRKIGLDQPDIEVPEIPDPPTSDSISELAKAAALRERIRRATRTGGGRAATIFTSARGVVGPTPIIKRTLTGA